MKTEEFDGLLRESLRLMATRAPAAGAVRLAGGNQARRRVLIGVALAIVVLPVVLWVGWPRPVLPPGDTGPTADRLDTPMTSGPTWLPPEFTERSRGRKFDGSQYRTFARTGEAPDSGQLLTFSYLLGDPGPNTPPGAPVANVEVNGHPAWLSGDGTDVVILGWSADSRQYQLDAQSTGLAGGELLRVAESVSAGRSDLLSTALVPPAGFELRDIAVHGTTAADAAMSMTLRGPFTVVLDVVPAPLPERYGDPVTVRGRPAQVFSLAPPVFGGHDVKLFVDLGGDRWLVARAQDERSASTLGPEDLIRVAETVGIGDTPPAPWMGLRP
ncbi:hypothetical protein [Actinokineospora sp. NBRC 105648]|uniref:hypothetical protein n=1 Tax=Actinokineospora sp. NBRC 105648 TaxID=3032206 RepID=UPI00249F9FDE|nr:hypothetical protein [Actinokineospora sp. NBRC 105648]GLZ38426.1 hypothetical protein Acsp05_20500 [Actinokineospora sp. NBRC 105648]